jgi:hypothetical protein
MFISITFLTSCFAKWADKKSAKNFEQIKAEKEVYDAIIVPGYPFDGDKWDKIVKLRVVWAYYLYKEGYTKHIIFSGSAVYSPYVESRIMKAYAVALGVPEKVIFTEERAEHSTENVFLSYRLAKENGFKNVALATDPWQSQWMWKFYKKHNCPLSYVPAVMSIVESLNIADPSIDPKPAYIEDFVSLTERETFRERWRGTKGKNIDFEKGVIIEKE